MNGVPDTLKGSYYANPIVDRPQVSAARKAEYPYEMPLSKFAQGLDKKF